MPSTQEDITRFQMEYGAEWSLFIHSDMWQAAKGFLMRNSPLSQLPQNNPAEIVAFAVVFCANAQGFQAGIVAMESLAIKLPGGPGLESLPTYTDPDVTAGEPPVAPPTPVHIPPKKKRK